MDRAQAHRTDLSSAPSETHAEHFIERRLARRAPPTPIQCLRESPPELLSGAERLRVGLDRSGVFDRLLGPEPGAAPVQGRGSLHDDPAMVHEAAQRGVASASGPLPHAAAIEAAFGRHDVTGVRAAVGGPADAACAEMGAVAYATGSAVAFARQPDVHTAAHEAAHVVQQRTGVSLRGGVGQAGDAYEQHADAVADRVVQGRSAEGLLDAFAGGAGGGAVQRQEETREEAEESSRPTAAECEDGGFKPAECALVDEGREAAEKWREAAEAGGQVDDESLSRGRCDAFDRQRSAAPVAEAEGHRPIVGCAPQGEQEIADVRGLFPAGIPVQVIGADRKLQVMDGPEAMPGPGEHVVIRQDDGSNLLIANRGGIQLQPPAWRDDPIAREVIRDVMPNADEYTITAVEDTNFEYGQWVMDAALAGVPPSVSAPAFRERAKWKMINALSTAIMSGAGMVGGDSTLMSNVPGLAEMFAGAIERTAGVAP